MKSELPIPAEAVRILSQLDQFRGAWAARPPLPERRALELTETSRVESVAASCRMAGIRVDDDTVAKVLRGPDPDTVEESRAIRGYAAALQRRFPADGPLVTTDEIRRLHAVTLGADGVEAGTPWRTEPYHLEVFDANGQAVGRVFQTLPPRLIAEKMDETVTWLELELRTRQTHPTLTVGKFMLYFVATCPFERGNGRTVHLLVHHLLRRAGLDYLPLASLERIFEEMRGDYFEALDASQTKIWSDEADMGPWLGFFLGALERHAERVRDTLDLERKAFRFSPLQKQIVETVGQHGTVGAGVLLDATGANRNTLKDNLRRLVDRGVLIRTGQKRGARYRLADGEPS